MIIGGMIKLDELEKGFCFTGKISVEDAENFAKVRDALSTTNNETLHYLIELAKKELEIK